MKIESVEERKRSIGMNDLVKRLQNMDPDICCPSVCEEAADEIEQLELLLSVEITQRTKYEIKLMDQQWIPVSERLPTDQQEILISITRNKMSYMEVCVFADHEFWNDGGYVFSPTHWVPLPPEPSDE